jgi:transketolase|tara:strand:- start:12217 stop:12693 length:477 start_codon:yes stop_codon:yes gene_type:complete
MRKLFASLLEKEIEHNKDIILLTADLGFGLWDSIRNRFPQNFVNVRSSEQLLIGTATGLALSGKIPICYSITPFLLYRPFEFIRNYLHNEQIPVKLVGGGRDGDYKDAGPTHWAYEHKEIMGCLNNIICYVPEDNIEVSETFNEFLYSKKSSYMNLRR